MAGHSCRMGRTGNDSLVWAHHSRRIVFSTVVHYPSPLFFFCLHTSRSGPLAPLFPLASYRGWWGGFGGGGGGGSTRSQARRPASFSKLQFKGSCGRRQGVASCSGKHQGRQQGSHKVPPFFACVSGYCRLTVPLLASSSATPPLSPAIVSLSVLPTLQPCFRLYSLNLNYMFETSSEQSIPS